MFHNPTTNPDVYNFKNRFFDESDIITLFSPFS